MFGKHEWWGKARRFALSHLTVGLIWLYALLLPVSLRVLNYAHDSFLCGVLVIAATARWRVKGGLAATLWACLWNIVHLGRQGYGLSQLWSLGISSLALNLAIAICLGYALQYSRQHTQALRESNERLSLLVYGSPDSMFEMDANLRYTWALNGLALYKDENLVGKTDYDLFPAAEADRLTAIKRQVLATGQQAEYEIALPTESEPRYFHVIIRPRLDEAGRVVGLVGYRRDLTEHERMKEQLGREEKRFQRILEQLNDAVLIQDLDGRLLEVNAAACESLGYTREELLRLSLTDIEAPQFASLAPDRLAVLLQDGKALLESAYRTKDGRIIPVEVNASIGEYQGVKAVLSIARNIGERKAAEEAQRVAKEQLVVWVNELEKRAGESKTLSDMSDLLQACLRTEEAYPVIASAASRLFPDDRGAVYVLNSSRNLAEAALFWGPEPSLPGTINPLNCWALRRGRAYTSDCARAGLLCPHLDATDVEILCLPMVAQGETLGVFAACFRNRPETVTDEPGLDRRVQLASDLCDHVALALANLRLRETLRNQAIRDPLTGLFNRRYMEETLERELRRAARKGTALGVVMMDIDHFKAYNDSFGHQAGDVLLGILGAYLRQCVRAEDVACRYGGEEFTLIMPDATLEETARRAEALVEGVRGLSAISQGKALSGVTVSVGVAAYPEHGDTGEALLQQADRALYRAKEQGRNQVVVCSCVQ